MGVGPGQSLSCPHSGSRDLPRGLGGLPGEAEVGCASPWGQGHLEHDKEKRMKRNADSLRDLWDNIKLTNIQIIGVPEEEEKEKESENI